MALGRRGRKKAKKAGSARTQVMSSLAKRFKKSGSQLSDQEIEALIKQVSKGRKKR